MKQKLHLLLIILSSIFIYISIYLLHQTKLQVKYICKKRNIQNNKLNLPKIKNFLFYKTIILNKLIPQTTNDIDVNKNKEFNFLLMGTSIFNNKKGAIFYFKDDHKCSPFNLGDSINDWKIKDIQDGQVLLEREGKTINITITNEKVSCSKIRISKSALQVYNKDIILNSPLIQSKKQHTQQIKTKSNNKNKTQPIKSNKIIKPTQKHNPFLELLKKMKQQKHDSTQQIKPTNNPFLELLKKYSK